MVMHVLGQQIHARQQNSFELLLQGAVALL